MIDARHPLAVLANRLPGRRSRRHWHHCFARRVLKPEPLHKTTCSAHPCKWPAPASRTAGRPAADPPDGQPAVPQARFQAQRRRVGERWAGGVVWQHFSGMQFYEPLPAVSQPRLDAFAPPSAKTGVERTAPRPPSTQRCSRRPSSQPSSERLIVGHRCRRKVLPVDSRACWRSRLLQGGGHSQAMRASPTNRLLRGRPKEPAPACGARLRHARQFQKAPAQRCSNASARSWAS